MIAKKDSERLRSPGKSFGFIPHRFLTDGFLQALSRQELALYLFLELASDQYFFINIC